MDFMINQQMLNDQSQSGALFYRENEAFSGVNKIAKKVMHDIELVFGSAPESTTDKASLSKHAVIYGTIGNSPILDELNEKQLIDLSKITGKREVFLFQVVDQPFSGVDKALVIAGSEKRATIYGLFHLSEKLGVSPLVDWSDVMPARKESFSLDGNYHYVSKEPSVKYRGFFINDEWPAFGNWSAKNFGGFNAEMYDHVFELLLRLKGNYLWPAMWSARFNDDGPGLANVELADEYGVIMGASHHEPCLRYGEEYKYLRGPNSKYGDAWNFISNREGITKFWEDGLKRTGQFENVITIGMRGEADTKIMGEDATLADNINLLRDVLQTQNKLIKENVNPNLSDVPRMLALYKEVEPFFYGDEETEGLINSEELEDVILMLCDDNHGNLRTLPTEEMRDHSGGYGMYYHFDYHGGPISYEWINSSYLPKIWEQMTMAYDFGVRDLWIVNVGDIATQEFPLSFFLDLAYDFEKWGTSAINQTDTYTKEWVEQQFAGAFNSDQQDRIFDLLTGYTRIAHKRRPEHMNVDVYHPVNYQETDRLIEEIDDLLDIAEELYQSVDKEHFTAYFAQVYYPAVGNLNLQKMWLLNGKNKYLAQLNVMAANQLAEQIKACLKRDQELVEEYHTIADGKFYGMGLSEHIGFVHWNEDENKNPVLSTVLPMNKPRLSVSIDGTEHKSEGSPWHLNTLPLLDFLEPDVDQASFTISSISEQDAEYHISSDQSWLSFSSKNGVLDGKDKVTETIQVSIDRQKLNGDSEGEFFIKTPVGKVTIVVPVGKIDPAAYPKMTFIETKGYVAIEAEHFADRHQTSNPDGTMNRFEVLDGYGKTLSGLKAFPTTTHFKVGQDAPYVEYQVVMQEAGTYELELYLQSSNPVTREGTMYCGVQTNDDEVNVINALPEGYHVDGPHWGADVINNIHKQQVEISCQEGLNNLRIYAVSPAFVLEKLVIYPEGKKPADSYLGPKETYYVGR